MTVPNAMAMWSLLAWIAISPAVSVLKMSIVNIYRERTQNGYIDKCKIDFYLFCIRSDSVLYRYIGFTRIGPHTS